MNKFLLSAFILLFVSCASFPPASISAGFLGADVTVSTPGWSAPVKVVNSPTVTTPVLLVPQGTAGTDEEATVAATATTTATVVPIQEAPVTTAVLALPTKK